MLHPTSIPPAKNPSKSSILAIRLVYQVISNVVNKIHHLSRNGYKGNEEGLQRQGWAQHASKLWSQSLVSLLK